MNQYQLNVAQASKCHRIGQASFSLMDDRQLGQKLVDALPDGAKPEPDQMLSALHDLLPAGDPILEPLKVMVQRPEFLALAMLRQANRQTNAQDQEEALLGSFSKIYRPEIMARLRNVLAGVREKGASRSPMVIEAIDGKSPESSGPISLSELGEHLKRLNLDPASSSASSIAPPDQTGQTSDSIPSQTSPEDYHERKQQMRQDRKADNSIDIEALDITLDFHKLSGRDLFQKNNKLPYYFYVILWPIFTLARLIWRFFTYPDRMKANIEQNITQITYTLTEQQKERK